VSAFSYSVVTKLPRSRVWSLLTDITNWPKFSDMYSGLRWHGTPWAEGSAIVGQLNYPIVVAGRYEIRECNAPVLIRYLSQTREAGFATERTITLEQLTEGTLIQADAYVVGRPEMPGGAQEFLRSLTTRWFDEFARFCDSQAVFGSDSQSGQEMTPSG
jgi:hypothetical protein